MRRSQRAMAVAIIYPEPQPGKRPTSSATKEVSGARLSVARAVLAYSRETGGKRHARSCAGHLDVALADAEHRPEVIARAGDQTHALFGRR